jgi:hypothetical protein
MRVGFSLSFLFLVLSPIVLSFPYFVYGFFVGLDLWWGFRLWVGFMGFGYYVFLLLQIAYYACRLPLVYVAAGGAVFLLFFFSMAAPGLVVLALVGFSSLWPWPCSSGCGAASSTAAGSWRLCGFSCGT